MKEGRKEGKQEGRMEMVEGRSKWEGVKMQKTGVKEQMKKDFFHK